MSHRSLITAVSGAAGMLAIAGILALTLNTGEHSSAGMHADDPPHTPTEVSFAAPSSEPNPDVESLISGIIDARQRKDRDALARALARTAGKTAPSEEDKHAAYRYFLWGSVDRLWTRIEDAWSEESYVISYDDDMAFAIFKTGGALGEVRLDFERHGNSWYWSGN